MTARRAGIRRRRGDRDLKYMALRGRENGMISFQTFYKTDQFIQKLLRENTQTGGFMDPTGRFQNLSQLWQ